MSESVFVSHAEADRKWVEQEIVAFLNAKGLRTWYTEGSIKSASQWEREILNGLESCDWFAIVVSPASSESEWVKDELSWAFLNRPNRIVPIIKEQCNLWDFHIRLPRLEYVDFTTDKQVAQQSLMDFLFPEARDEQSLELNQPLEFNKNIFVSFSKQDQSAALEILGRLEAAGLRCWISCRDVPHGYDYQDSIVEALDRAGAVLLVFSDNANGSAEIKKELAIASENELFVLPVRIEDTQPTKGLRYQIATRQYINLFEDRDKNMTMVVDSLRKYLQSISK
jgi:hypothetical protein